SRFWAMGSSSYGPATPAALQGTTGRHIRHLGSTGGETSVRGTAVCWGSMAGPHIAFLESLAADPSRAAMCLALAGGEARPAGELAARAGVSAQTASNHLAKLIAARMLRVAQ